MSRFKTIFFDTNYFELPLNRQKLGTFLQNKVLQKLKFSKNISNKKCAPKLTFFNDKKKLRKIQLILDIEN